MFSYIEKLRKEPLEKRRQAAIVATITIVGVVILLWIVYLLLVGALFDTNTPDSSEPQVTGGIENPY